jgi:hypothetical protein
VAALTMAFSLVTLTTVYSGGYCDSLTYLVVFCMWWWRRHPFVFFGLFFAGLFNRESIAFLAPWFAWVGVSEAQRRGSTAIVHATGFGIALGVYLLFRAWVSTQVSVLYDLSFYVDPLLSAPFVLFSQTAGVEWVGLFSVFKILWLLPILAAASMWSRGERTSVLGLALLLVLAWTQMLFAWDTSRMLTLGFMVMLVSLEHLFATGAYRFREWVPWLLVLNLLVPQLAVTRVITPMHGLIQNAILVGFLGKSTWQRARTSPGRVRR